MNVFMPNSRYSWYLFLLALLTTMAAMLPLQAYAHGMSEADIETMLNASTWDFVQIGAAHMLTGYDHLLFLLGVIFFLSRFFDIVKFITAFTIGHSITLVFATLFEIQANYYAVDAVIALTVCYKAFENLDGFKRYLEIKSPNLMAMVFGFGLIHGFGLSTRLQQLPLGDEGIVTKILAFNLGVELGQILALAIMLVLIAGWRQSPSFAKFSKAINGVLLIVGALLFLMQMHGYQHSVYSDEFPLNQDDHYHIHKNMDAAYVPVSVEVPSELYDTSHLEQPNEEANNDIHSHDGINYHSH